MYTKIDSVLKKTAKTYNLETAVNKHRTLKHWKEIAGAYIEEARELTQAIDFKKGVLTVACLSREVASKLRLLADRIIAALNQLLGKQVVHAIYFET